MSSEALEPQKKRAFEPLPGPAKSSKVTCRGTARSTLEVLLLRAVETAEWEEAKRLVGAGAKLTEKNKKGMNVLMLASWKNADFARFLLEHGGEKLLVSRRNGKITTSSGKLTAADYAEKGKNSELAAELKELQLQAQVKLQNQCKVCGESVNQRPKLLSLETRVQGGLETNKLVIQFFEGVAAQLMKKEMYHQLNDYKYLRKELTESVSIFNVVTNIMNTRGTKALHIIDLCCGKSLTTAYLSLEFSEAQVTAVDLISPSLLPHYAAAVDTNVKYLQLDLFSKDFGAQMESRVNAVGLPTVVLGMHLCGALSVRAIELYQSSELISDIVLCPCCLPSKASAPTDLYQSTDQIELYGAWVAHLVGQLEKGEQGAWKEDRKGKEKEGESHADGCADGFVVDEPSAPPIKSTTRFFKDDAIVSPLSSIIHAEKHMQKSSSR
jgi:hypothetical protein